MTLALPSAVAVGLSLGLLGSGGSILTVPILIYLLGQADKTAIAGSLAIVGAISLVGAIPYALRRQIDWRTVLYFGAPGMLGAWGGAHLAHYVSGTFQLLIFSIIMLLAAAFMLRPAVPSAATAGTAPQAWWLTGLEGLAVGAVTGLVGVGGGFLIVPALVLLAGLPMHIAVGTSLLIIALKSCVGLFEYFQVLNGAGLALDWTVIAVFSVLGIAGSFLGSKLGKHLSRTILQRVFAGFLIAIGGFILWQKLGELL